MISNEHREKTECLNPADCGINNMRIVNKREELGK